ncbi:MAG TPA: DUF3352 domain-containing protein [Nocardioidaceae bacterium]|nr:DUF3352 domain-containing protein [Nocardioidaceae bacterium]
MSSNTPFEPTGEPEFLTQGTPEPAPAKAGRTKVVVLAGVGVVAAGAIGIGAWGVAQFLGGGPGAASVLPDTALLYAAVDIDPSAGQKIEAIKTLKKFPALDAVLGLDARDDVRRFVVERLVKDGTCKDLDYDAAVEPWLGDKLGVALLPGDGVPMPVIAIQVTDEGKAEAGIDRIFEACAPGEEHGLAFLDGYALVAPDDETAEAAKAAATKAPLSEDARFKDALESVGELGVATFYVSAEGPKALADSFLGGMMGAAGVPDQSEQLNKALSDFKGAAGTIRFDGGGVELAVAGAGLPSMGAGSTSIADLPASTIAALGFSLPEGWTDDFAAQIEGAFGPGMYEGMLQEAESATGLKLPEDLEKIFGSDSVIALDGSTDFDAMVNSEDLSSVKAGLRVESDEAEVRRIAAALLRAAGEPNGDFLKIKGADGKVAVGFDEAYLDQLLAGGDLGSDETFRDAVPEAEKARFAFFVDFNAADDWLVRFAGSMTDGDKEFVENVRPLGAFGVSGWLEGDTGHLVLRLSTD